MLAPSRGGDEPLLVCTLSFWPSGDGYLLLHSRDEHRTRAAGEDPRAHRGGRTPFLAPRDGEAGGTWLGVDGKGRTLCVLNGPEDDPSFRLSGEERSRGQLVADLLEDLQGAVLRASLQAALERDRYRPFLLVLATRERHGAHLETFRWTGAKLGHQSHRDAHLEASSGLDHDAVATWRKARFQDLRAELSALGERERRRKLWEFHHGHSELAAAGDERTVCMHREEARTQSLCLVDARTERPRLVYRHGSPCERQPLKGYRPS